jgi:hypothetical protein
MSLAKNPDLEAYNDLVEQAYNHAIEQSDALEGGLPEAELNRAVVNNLSLALDAAAANKKNMHPIALMARSAMAAFGAPSGGSIDLTSDEQQQVNTAIAAAWA